LLKNSSDIFVKKSTIDVLPFKVDSSLIEQNLIGSLVETDATLFDKDGNTWFMTDKLGGFKVYLKKGTQIASSAFEVNDHLKIGGVLALNNGEIVLLPRMEADIVKIMEEVSDNLGGSIKSEQKITPGDAGQNVYRALGVLSLVLGLISVGLFLFRYLNKRKVRALGVVLES